MKVLRLLAAILALSAAFPLAAQTLPPQQFADLGDVKLQNGSTIRNCRLGYRTLGTLNAARSNAILYPTWFSGNTAGNFATVGPKGYFDTTGYYVIFVDALGDGVSCSPSNSSAQPGPAFPWFTIRDMVDTEYSLVTEKLGLHHLRAVMGQSMGGMQTFEWIVRYPTMMDIAIPIVGSPKMSSYDMLLWRMEEKAILDLPAYRGGKYTTSPPIQMTQLIHNLNLTTPEYRAQHTSPVDFEKFFRDTEATTNGAFDANDWRWQIHAMLSQDVASGGSMEDAAKRVKAKVLVVASAQDHMVNPISALHFAELIHAQLLLLKGNCGHLAPSCEVDTIRPQVEAILKAK